MVDLSGNKVWQPLPIKNLLTGQLIDTPSMIDSNTFNDGTYYQAIDAIPVQACLAFKISVTGIGGGGTSGTVGELRVMARNN